MAVTTNDAIITDKQRIDWLENVGDMPSYSRHSGKWEYNPWSDSRKFETLREAIDWKINKLPVYEE